MEAEYKIDDNNSVLMMIDQNSAVDKGDVAFYELIDSATLSIGPHELSVRFKDSEGVWSYWDKSYVRNRFFRVTGKQYLTAAEWFIDTDPGMGNGSVISLPSDGVWDSAIEDVTVEIHSDTLSIGFHTLYTRYKDQDGNWGKTNQSVFEISEPLIIRAAEWVLDPTTEYGKGNPMKPADGKFDSAVEELVSDELLYDDFPPDTVVYIRVQDSLNFSSDGENNPSDSAYRGRWSSNNGWREEAKIVINPKNEQLEPTPTPTVTPIISVSTPTPTIPESTPTPTAKPSDPNRITFAATLIKTLECDKDDLSACGWMEIPGGFDALKSGKVSPQQLEANLIPSSKDLKGLLFELTPNAVSMLMGLESVSVTGEQQILMRAYIRSMGKNAQFVLGALKGEFTSAKDVDGTLGMNLIKSSSTFVDKEGVISILFKPDSGELITPFIQASGSGPGIYNEKVWLDRIEIYRYEQEQ